MVSVIECKIIRVGVASYIGYGETSVVLPRMDERALIPRFGNFIELRKTSRTGGVPMISGKKTGASWMPCGIQCDARVIGGCGP